MMRQHFIGLGLMLGLVACSEKESEPDNAQPNQEQEVVPSDEPAEFSLLDFERQSRRELSSATYQHNEAWGMNKCIRWDADLEQGVISWSFADKMVTAPVQVICTYSPLQQQLVWAWNNDSIADKLAVDSLKLKAWGEEHSVSDLTSPLVPCSETRAWTYTAMAAKIVGAKGAYRGADGNVFIFFTFGDIHIGPPATLPSEGSQE